jgi:hypothetical protein
MEGRNDFGRPQVRRKSRFGLQEHAQNRHVLPGFFGLEIGEDLELCGAAGPGWHAVPSADDRRWATRMDLTLLVYK